MRTFRACMALAIVGLAPLQAQQATTSTTQTTSANDATAGGAVKPVVPKKSALDGARSVNSSGSAKAKEDDKVENAVANPEEAQARGIQPEDNSPDVGMFVVMANKGWDSINPASPNKPVYSEVIQERGPAPTFSNNMMDSPDGSQRPNDGFKLFGWTY